MDNIYLPSKTIPVVLERFDLDNVDDVVKLNDITFLEGRDVELNPKAVARIKNAIGLHSLVSKIESMIVKEDNV